MRARGSRIYRAALRLYPRAFRDRYGEEMAVTFERMVATSRARGRFLGYAAFLRGLGNAVAGAVGERRGGAGRVPGAAGHDEDKRGRRGNMGGLLRDARFAVRSIRKQPLFTLVAAGSLAIGIGANTAVFSVANALLLQPLPGIGNYARIVELGRSRDGSGFDTFAYPDFLDIRSEVPGLESAIAYSFETLSVSVDAEGMRATGLSVSADYFTLMGTAPGQGRYFLSHEDTGVDAHPVVVLSNRFWVDRLGADPDAVGSTIYLNRQAFEVVGVTPPEFRGHVIGFEPDVFVPITQVPMLNEGRNDFENRSASWHLALGLLAEGTSIEQLNRQLEDVGARLAEAYPESNARRSFRAVPLGPIPGGGRAGVQLFLTALLGMVVLIMLVTCTNVAGMFLARAASREREVAVRVAIGAGRGAIVQQLTVETLSVFVLGGGLGVTLGLWAVGLLRPERLPLPVTLHFAIRPEPTVIVGSVAVTLLTGIIFGLMPALRATRLDVARAMGEGGRGATGTRGSRLRLVFAAGQVGLSLILLASAGLFVRSLQRAASIDAGFDPTGSYVTFLDLSLEGYDEAEGPIFQEELLTSLRGLAWVNSATLATDLPLDLGRSGTAAFPEGWDPGDETQMLPVDFSHVSDGYFETLSIPVLSGRTFAVSDRAGTEDVAVVSRTFAERAWPGQDPLGRRFQFGRPSDDPRWITVIGIVGDVKNMVITETPDPFAYVPLAQRYRASFQIVVQSDAPGEVVRSGLAEALRAADPNASRGPIESLSEYTALGTLPHRISAGLTSGLGLLALLLSGLGIYGVISFAVGRQQREIGIRMALGEHPRSVTRHYLRRGVLLAVPGLVIGGALSLAVGRVMRSLLLDLSPYDPTALGTVSLMLFGVVVFASWLPARRAARVDPADSLRSN